MRPVVLIVDDEPAIRKVLSRALAADGHELLLAGEATEALELVVGTRARVSVAVIDMHLNGTDGPDLAKLLRLLQPGLTVLFTTGYGEGEQERVPRDPLLPKPFPPAKVAQCVRDLVATGRCECCARLAGGM
jgi:two-component system cell cycle sensor histidine kinase/response regulator CckA